ncbi:MAG: GNVR domain-containing protein, partial [Pirellulales bacterium]
VRELERRVQVVETNYLTYVTGLEETRVDQALREAEMPNIRVVQSASVARQPIRPRKGLTLALAVVVATVGGLSIPLLSAQFDHSLTTCEEIERWLNAPLLVSIRRTNPNSMTIGHILSGARR